MGDRKKKPNKDSDKDDYARKRALAAAGKARVPPRGRPVSEWDELNRRPDAASAYEEVEYVMSSPELHIPSDEEYTYDARDFEQQNDDHSDGAGAASPGPSAMITPLTREDHWENRKQEMDRLLAEHNEDREAVLAQIKDLQDSVCAIDSRISDAKKAQAQIDHLIRRREPDPKGKNFLSDLPADIKYILKTYLTGLDLANLRAVDRTWNGDIDNDRDGRRIQDEKERWVRPMDRIDTVVVNDYREEMVDFVWYLDTPVFISHNLEANYVFKGRQVTTQLMNNKSYYLYLHFYGGTDHIFAWDRHSRMIRFARWGEPRTSRYKLPPYEKCELIVPFDGELYFADYSIVRRFIPQAEVEEGENKPQSHEAITHPPSRVSQIVTFAMSEKYVLKAKGSRVELWKRGTSRPHVIISVGGVHALAMAGSTICIPKSNSITLYGDDGQPKRVFQFATDVLRLANPLGHVDGSFVFDSLTDPNRLFRLARYAEHDKLKDENMQKIVSKQYSKSGKLGVFVAQVFQGPPGPNHLFVSRSG